MKGNCLIMDNHLIYCIYSYLHLVSGRILTRYLVSGRVFSQIFGIQSDIWPDIRYLVGYLARYKVSVGYWPDIGIRSDIWPDIRYQVGCSARYLLFGWIFGQISGIQSDNCQIWVSVRIFDQIYVIWSDIWADI